MQYRIVITGPESTGKSTLTRQLAQSFGTSYVDEYAREFLSPGNNYVYDDLWEIAKGQLRNEDKVEGELAFLDTNLYVIKTWSEFVFKNCDNRVLARLAERKYHLYILCDIDMPWQDDPLREHPDPRDRKLLFNHYHADLVAQETPWVIVNGSTGNRFEMAVKAVNNFIQVTKAS